MPVKASVIATRRKMESLSKLVVGLKIGFSGIKSVISPETTFTAIRIQITPQNWLWLISLAIVKATKMTGSGNSKSDLTAANLPCFSWGTRSGIIACAGPKPRFEKTIARVMVVKTMA